MPQRAGRWPFWKAISQGHNSEHAAATAGVSPAVYTVGIGITQGETIGFEDWRMRVRLEKETLKNISILTHGKFFYAGTAEGLKKVYSVARLARGDRAKGNRDQRAFSGSGHFAVDAGRQDFGCGGLGAWLDVAAGAAQHRGHTT